MPELLKGLGGEAPACEEQHAGSGAGRTLVVDQAQELGVRPEGGPGIHLLPGVLEEDEAGGWTGDAVAGEAARVFPVVAAAGG